MQAVTIPGGFEALATVANLMVQQTSCSTLAPLIRAAYAIFSTVSSLGLNDAQLLQVQQADPQLASCILSTVVDAGEIMT